MSLPRRNPIVLVAYSLAILGMFAFLTWVSLPLVEYAQTPNTSEGITDELRVSYQTKYLDEFIVSGHQHHIDLSGDTDAQLAEFWQRFSTADVAGQLHSLVKDEKVYAVYHDYNPQNNSVYITLGYRTSHAVQTSDYSLASAEVYAGHYSTGQRQQFCVGHLDQHCRQFIPEVSKRF